MDLSTYNTLFGLIIISLTLLSIFLIKFNYLNQIKIPKMLNPLLFYAMDLYYTSIFYKRSCISKIEKYRSKKFNSKKIQNEKKDTGDSIFTKVLIDPVVAIIGGIAASIIFALMSNTMHWTWIFNYIIIGFILIGGAITLIGVERHSRRSLFLLCIFFNLNNSVYLYH